MMDPNETPAAPNMSAVSEGLMTQEELEEEQAMYEKLQEIQKLGKMVKADKPQPRVELSRARWMRNYVSGTPERPAEVQMKNTYYNSIDLAWYPSNCHRAAITQYDLKMNGIIVFTGPDIMYTARNLRSNTWYEFQVAATNVCGTSLYSNPVKYQTIPGPPGPPEPPTLDETSQRFLIVSWEPPWDGGSPVLAYKLFVNERPRFEGPEKTFKVEGLLEAQAYRFRVQASNAFGVGQFSQESFHETLPGPPDIPTALELTDETYEQVLFSWKSAPRAGATIDYFEVFCNDKLEFTGTQQQYIKTGLRPFHTYIFKVYAVNQYGKSPDSDTITLVTGTAPPEQTTHLKCVHASSRHLSIEWRVPFDNGERITNYRLFMKKKDESEKKEKKGMYFKNKPMGKRGQMQPDNSDVKWTEAEVYTGAESRVRIKGLEPSGLYKFRVCATNACGDGGFSEECGFRCDGTHYELWTCGANSDGRCGTDPGRNMENSILLLPRKMPYWDQFRGVRAVSCGNKHTHVVTWDGHIWAWGSGEYGKLGLGGGSNTPEPRPVDYVENQFFIAVSSGYDHSVFLTEMGAVYSCGRSDVGQCGSGLATMTNPNPHKVEALTDANIIQVSTGSNFTAYLDATGKVFTSGDGNSGRLGHGDEEVCLSPVLVKKLDDDGTIIHAISSGGNHIVAVDRDGIVFSWGYNNCGQLGIGSLETQLLPVKMVKVEGLVFQQCSTGGSHTALSTNEGKMYTCGWGMFCGRGKTENSLTPEIVPAMDGKHVRQIECGRSQTACVTDIGEIWNWGIGACGQLGHGDDEDRLLPALVIAIQSEGACKLSCGSLHMAVISSQNQNQQHMTDGEPNGMDGLYAKDTHGRTILQRSVLTNNLEVTKWLADNSADMYTQNSLGETVLHTSVRCGLIDVLNYLLHKTNFKVFDTKDGEGRDVIELAMLLKQRKVAINLINYFGKHYARGRCQQGILACNNDVDELQMNFSDKQDVQQSDLLYNRNPLYWAVAFGRVDATKLLVQNSEWVNERDFQMQTPLYVGFCGDTPEHTECCRVLLQHEARLYFPVPDVYGKQPGDYSFYDPIIQLQKEFVQISLVTDYNFNPIVVSSDKIASYDSLAIECARISESQREAKHMILQIDVEGDDELDVTDETMKEFKDDAAKGVGSINILITPSTEYDPPVPDEYQWEQQFWTDQLPRYGGVAVACEKTMMEELDHAGLITELTLLDKPRLKYNKEYARAVEDDISVLNWELKQKSDLLEGLREDLEEVTEKEQRLIDENAEVDRLLETMNERLEFYDNQVDSWEGRLRASVGGGSVGSDGGSDSGGSFGRNSAAAGARIRNAARAANDVDGAKGEGSGTCIVS